MRKLLLAMLLIPSIGLAQPTPVGSWQSYDSNNNARNIIRFSAQGGSLVGTIARVTSFQGEKPICYKCQGRWHNKPLLGMPIIWGLHKEGDKWVNGHVLAIDDGKTYGCEVSVSSDGNTLYFRGYSGTPLFGKTIEWRRVGH